MVLAVCMEKLITISEDSPTKIAVVPVSKRKSKTLPQMYFEELKAQPYKYTEQELAKRIHHDLRNMPHLKIENYNIKRSPLLERFGWGIHVDGAGRLGLVGCDSEKYLQFLQNPDIKKVKAYRTRK